jgi:hypothetical protein
MHIIFGDKLATELSNKYTVLELDSFRVGASKDITKAYSIIENISLDQILNLDKLKHLHQDLMENYKQKNWELCQVAIKELRGNWGGELDSFYDELTTRITKFTEQDPGPEWSPVLFRVSL